MSEHGDEAQPGRHQHKKSDTKHGRRKSDGRKRDHSRDKRNKRRKDVRSKESEKERLLRKAREYVREHEKTDDGKNERRARQERKAGERRSHSRGGGEGGGDGNEDDDRKPRRRSSSKRQREGSHRDRDDGPLDDAGRGRDRSEGGLYGESKKRKRHRDRTRHCEERERSRSDSRGNGPDDGRKRKHKAEKKRERHHDSRRGGRHERGRQKKKQRKDERADVGDHSSRTNHAAPTVKVNKNELYPLGPIRSAPPSTKLDPEADYFQYHSHLRLYLYRERGVYFEDLSSEEARDAFTDFVQLYNDGSKLEEAYYDPAGLPAPALEECKRTKHKWTFKTNETEKRSLDLVKEGVRRQTEWKDKSSSGGGLKNTHSSSVTSSVKPAMDSQGGIVAATEGDGPAMQRNIEGLNSDDAGQDHRLKAQNSGMQRKDQDEKRAAMLEMIGLKGIDPGKKITIAPRNDG